MILEQDISTEILLQQVSDMNKTFNQLQVVHFNQKLDKTQLYLEGSNILLF